MWLSGGHDSMSAWPEATGSSVSADCDERTQRYWVWSLQKASRLQTRQSAEPPKIKSENVRTSLD